MIKKPVPQDELADSPVSITETYVTHCSFVNERFEFSARRRVILPKAFVMFVIAPGKTHYMVLDY
jgi:hypothetical protein